MHNSIKGQIVRELSKFSNFILLDSHVMHNMHYSNAEDAYSRYDWIIATGKKSNLPAEDFSPEKWSAFLDENSGKWSFGFWAYDLKNKLEKLPDTVPGFLHLPEFYWYIPQYIVTCKEGGIEIWAQDEQDELKQKLQAIISGKTEGYHTDDILDHPVDIRQRVSRNEYLGNVQKLKEHIQRGDIYEVNYCIEFYAEQVDIDPLVLWNRLSAESPMPFSAFIDTPDFAVISASPERFLLKEKNILIAQPMKGTIRRGTTAEEDEQLITALQNDPKEQSENVMIVDLVRNDLSRSAVKGSVKVERLFGIHTFPKVHQMVSTVSAELRKDIPAGKAIALAFPMGSMTGAPKIRAMELIDQYEASRRGIFSGSIGYCSPDGNMDMNVVIRTIVYDKKTKYLSVSVGSAITINSDPEKEYEECMLKIAPMLKALNTQLS